MRQPLFEGSVDAIDGGVILGWARDASQPDRCVDVEVVQRSTVLASARANIYRRDLQLAGKGTGFHSFRVRVHASLPPGRHEVEVRIAGSGHVLNGKTFTVQVTAGEDPPPAFDRRASTEGRFCPMPFEKLVLKRDGGVNLCCPSYVPSVIGNANFHTLDEIWNSPIAQDIRASIVDGSFRYCRDLCPEIQKGTLPLLSEAGPHQQDVDQARFRLEHGPVFVSLLQDRTCNLSCPSCRTDILIADSEEQERLRLLLKRIIDPLLPSVHTLEIAGGEFLASRHLREVLARIDREKHPNLRLVLWTNGTLLNEKTWLQLKNIHDRVQTIHVSIDAATPRTFETLRRGGVWETFRRNLDFIAALRRAGECRELNLMFVVQRQNFHEMGDFVDLGREIGCDAVKFHELLNFDTFTPREFACENVLDPQHELHAELAEVLFDPRLDDPIADLGNLTAIRARFAAERHHPVASLVP